MKLLRRFFLHSVLWALFATGAGAADQFIAGRDYRFIDTPQAVQSGSKVEVLEFFWYGCIHCYHLEAPLKAWLKHLPVDVKFQHVPAVFDAARWSPLARFYYVMEDNGLVGKYHDDLFDAIHKDNHTELITEPNAMADWLAQRGMSRQKFLDSYNSAAIKARMQHSIEMTRAYDLPSTPALVIDGKYLAIPSMALNPDKSIDYQRFFEVVDKLISQARTERKAKEPVTNNRPASATKAAPAPSKK